MFTKVLIANRGEIAVRVVRACQELGIATVVVHSTRDRESEAVRLADESIQIGPQAPRRSYLNAAAILEAALRTGAQAIHPGYGFLSEDPEFAQACQEQGIVFIGPPPEVMAELGSKISARKIMQRSGLPLLPGSLDSLDATAAEALAERIGFPVILKPSAGGGGRGMQIVYRKEDFAAAHRQGVATARMLFGDGSVYVEKYLAVARHVEIQILCDQDGNGIHLGARDCTVQRRHQKLIEESPAPELPADFTNTMGEMAVRAAINAGYTGAGTFEFLVTPELEYFFMEINCRIQVEHPVTEMVTGVDLVQEQFRIASGLGLRLRQEDVSSRGVSIECRINAEDPARDFAPTPGRVDEFRPAAGPFVRVDTHIRPGDVIPPDYDSLIAKLVVWADTREAAIARMNRALSEFTVTGPTVRTTIGFLQEVLHNEHFRSASHSTGLVDEILSTRLHLAIQDRAS